MKYKKFFIVFLFSFLGLTGQKPSCVPGIPCKKDKDCQGLESPLKNAIGEWRCEKDVCVWKSKKLINSEINIENIFQKKIYLIGLNEQFSAQEKSSLKKCLCFPDGSTCIADWIYKRYYPEAYEEYNKTGKYPSNWPPPPVYDETKKCPEDEICTGDVNGPGECHKLCYDPKATTKITKKACHPEEICSTISIIGWENEPVWTIAICEPPQKQLGTIQEPKKCKTDKDCEGLETKSPEGKWVCIDGECGYKEK